MFRIAVLSLILLVPGCAPKGDPRADLARSKIGNLTAACKVYKLDNGDWPPSLDALTAPQPKGGNPLVTPELLTDEWSNPIRYHHAGPKNNGEQPDIWCETPQGKVIGNWPEGR